jgi:exodeoxyribonuclease-1
MGASFYFYDLETSGLNARHARIMQFGGQRTDMDLKPIGKPDNILIKMTPDILPEPDAVLVHGITPQKTLADGITEAEFAKYLTGQVCTPNTIMVGFNNIRFDDEFIRFTLWRNFHDAYEWHWKDGCSRWDILDVVRMTRALRPEGLEWPLDSDGRASNRLELLSKINGLDHQSSHDALSDVKAVLALAQLLKISQPKMFDYLLNLRDKRKVKGLVTTGEPFVYTSGRYSSDFYKTTVAVMLAAHPDKDAALVYDLREDPDKLLNLSPQELAHWWKCYQRRDEGIEYFPVKELQYNRCPAVSPMNVLDKKTEKRLQLDASSIKANLDKLSKSESFGKKMAEAAEMMKRPTQASLVADEYKVDSQLYDDYIPNADKTKMSVVRTAQPEELSELGLDFVDSRLKALLPLYKARNFPKSLSPDEQQLWHKFRSHKLQDGGSKSRASSYFRRIEQLKGSPSTSDEQRYILEELELYGDSVVPETNSTAASKAAF